MAFRQMTPFAAGLAAGGVRYLLADHELPAALSLCRGESLAALAPRPGVAPRQDPHKPRPGAWQPPSRPGAAEPAAGAPRQPTPRPEFPGRARALQAPLGQTRQPPAAPAPAAPARRPFLPIRDWPADWAALLRRTKKAALCWTYWELGLDLTGRVDAARRQLLVRMIADLDLHKGAHTFWPCALPAGDGPSPDLAGDPRLFWTGLQETRARTLVVAGQKAAEAIALPGEFTPLRLRTVFGVRVLAIWDFASLSDRGRYESAMTFLRASLAAFRAI